MVNYDVDHTKFLAKLKRHRRSSLRHAYQNDDIWVTFGLTLKTNSRQNEILSDPIRMKV